MKTKLNNVNKGFTIIEVMIVLAIAGLILAIVFFAVPQLQRNQRDNQRQSVANRVKAELDTYASNNQGTYPFTGVNGTWTTCSITVAGAAKTCNDFGYRYLGTGGGATSGVNINDPATNAPMPIQISNNASLPSPTVKGTLYIAVGSKCNGDSIQASSGSATYAVVVGLDRSGTRYCVDNG